MKKYVIITTKPKLTNPNNVPVHCINVLNRLKHVKEVINDIPIEIRNEGVSKIHLEMIKW